MNPQITRAEVVPEGIVIAFDDKREAFLLTEDLLGLAETVNAFARAEEMGRGDNAWQRASDPEKK